MREALSGAFRTAFSNGGVKQTSFVAVPTALIAVIGTVLAQVYVLPQPPSPPDATLAARVIALEHDVRAAEYNDQMWRGQHEDKAEEIVKRLEQKIDTVQDQMGRIERKLDNLRSQ